MNKKQIQRIERAVSILRSVDAEMIEKQNRGKLFVGPERFQVQALYNAILHLESAVKEIKDYQEAQA